MKKLVLFFLAALLLCGCGNREAEVIPEYVLTYAENQPREYPTTMGAEYFARLVEERTGGRIIIEVICDAQMGTQEEALEQLAFGGIDFARVSLSSISDELPILNVLQLPFLYEDAGHMWRILDGQIGGDFLEVFRQAGLVGLSWYDGGVRSFYAESPIQSAEDLRGLRIRVQESRMMEDMVYLLGGIPRLADYSEVYAAFETGRIDAAENSWASYESQNHYDVAPYFTVDEHTRVPEIQLTSGMLWEELSEEYRAIIVECAREAALYERQIWTQWEQTGRANAIAAGAREIILEDAELEKLKQAVLPLYESYCADYLDLIAQIQAG